MTLSLRDRVMKEINMLMLEGAWTELTTGQITDRILAAIQEDNDE